MTTDGETRSSGQDISMLTLFGHVCSVIESPLAPDELEKKLAEVTVRLGRRGLRAIGAPAATVFIADHRRSGRYVALLGSARRYGSATAWARYTIERNGESSVLRPRLTANPSAKRALAWVLGGFVVVFGSFLVFGVLALFGRGHGDWQVFPLGLVLLPTIVVGVMHIGERVLRADALRLSMTLTEIAAAPSGHQRKMNRVNS